MAANETSHCLANGEGGGGGRAPNNKLKVFKKKRLTFFHVLESTPEMFLMFINASNNAHFRRN